jgi:hypothetical protein
MKFGAQEKESCIASNSARQPPKFFSSPQSKGVFEVKILRRVFGDIAEYSKKVRKDLQRRVLPRAKKVYAEFRDGEHDEIVLCLFVLNFMCQCVYFMIYW